MKRPLILVLTLLVAVLFTGVFIRSVAATNISSIDQPLAQESIATLRQLPGPLAQGQRAQDAATSSNCEDGRQDSGAEYRICTPTLPWNGGLVVYAHGYVAPDRPVEIPEGQMVLPNGQTIDEVVNSLGYAFATTSYYTNGLAVLPALSDLLDLVSIFTTTRGMPNSVYLIGVSEGGLITTLAVEQYPDVFDGGLAMCGPYGDFRGQINHFGDFRVVFDYFFPDLMPGTAITIPDSLMESWESGYYSTTIKPAIEDTENMTKVNQLLNVTGVSPYAYAPPTSTSVIENLLWYNVFATNDGKTKLGGLPFDNQDRIYNGSNDDVQLNQGVDRISADQAALDEIAANYQTIGHLGVPLVTLHTTGDTVVPYWHATRYRGKTIAADNIALHEHFKVERHGHCNFTFIEMLGAFTYLVDMVDNPPPYQPVSRVFLPSIVRAP